MTSDNSVSYLSQYLEFRNGRSSPERAEDGAVPVYGSNGVIGYTKVSNAGPDTIIIGRVGSYCGSVHFSDSSCWVTDNAIACTSKHKRDPGFWYYYLLQANLNQYRSGSGQPLLNQGTLNSISCDVPADADERANIGAFLATFDNKANTHKCINQTLEHMAQALFKSWFVDFEPVKAKIAVLQDGGSEEDALLAAMQAISGRSLEALETFQQEQPQHYAELKATAELFPSAMQDSKLGEIPEGWSTGTLGDLADLNASSWSKKTLPAEIEYVDLSNTNNGVIESTTRYLAGDAPSRARRRVKSGVTIFGTVRPGNRSFAFIDSPLPELTVSTGFAVLSPKSEEFTEFVYICATRDETVDYFAHLADGGAYPAIRPDVVTQLGVVLASDKIFTAFHGSVKSHFALMASNLRRSNTLAELRDALLPKLLSGELSVSGTDQPVEVIQ